MSGTAGGGGRETRQQADKRVFRRKSCMNIVPDRLRWCCCVPCGRHSRRWQQCPHLSSRKLLTLKAFTGFWPACPASGSRGKFGPLTRREFARLATGISGRIPSKACGAKCFCGCRRTLTPTPRICWQNYARPIRADSEMLSCEHCSAG